MGDRASGCKVWWCFSCHAASLKHGSCSQGACSCGSPFWPSETQMMECWSSIQAVGCWFWAAHWLWFPQWMPLVAQNGMKRPLRVHFEWVKNINQVQVSFLPLSLHTPARRQTGGGLHEYLIFSSSTPCMQSIGSMKNLGLKFTSVIAGLLEAT